jgi:hypothetical protein
MKGLYHGGVLPGAYGCTCGSGYGSPFGCCCGKSSGYGNTETAPSTQETAAGEYEVYLKTGLDLLAQYRMQTKDPRTQVALMQAKIQNYEMLKQRNPALSGIYDIQIRKLQARLQAAQQQLQIRAESEAATRQWRGLGQAGIGIGILAGVGVLAVTAAGAIYLAKRA